MKTVFIYLILVLIATATHAQYEYEPSETYPFGRPNPEAAPQIKDFDLLIGECDCDSYARNPDQTWPEKPTAMIWRWKYILNGHGVQDETLKADGGHSGSIRQFIADSAKWYVHYYSNKTPTTRLSTWEGGKRGDSIVLYNEQKAPNGMDGYFRITFKDMTTSGFTWLGEWVDKGENFRFPTWKIYCRRKN